MEAKPLRIVPSSHNSSGGGPLKKIDMVHAMDEGVVVVSEGKERVVMVKEEKDNSFSSVELHLGVDASHSAAQPHETINHVITEAQRSELHHQVFIFNHLAYKLAPPHHLVQFPSNMSEYSFLGFDHGSMVDPEPHRCRRTDGKKWRCGKNVVPNQKYCERHMHRGRNRSRKPVETSQVNSPLAINPCSKSHTKPASRGELEISNAKPLAIYPSDTSSNTPSRILSVGNCPSANNRSKIVATSTNYLTPIASASVVPPGSPLVAAVTPKMTTFTSATTAASDEKSCLKMFKKDYQSKSCTGHNIGVRSGGKGSIVGDTNGISTGIGFSPRSVLQVSVCKPSYLNDRTNIEPASSRCRRTDGKKWQCKSAVLPGQKYCARHMHRGAKKRVKTDEPAATTTSAVTIAQLPYSSATTNNQKAHCAIPNTNLSMSVAASAPFIECNEKSCHSSSDTDTTISDTLNECSYASF